MRLPKLAGYKIEEILNEDSFGWNFVSTHQSGENRCVRVLKAQATNDAFIYHVLRPFIESGFAIPGVAPVYDLVFQEDDTLTMMATPLYGWRTKDSDSWQLTSLALLRSMLSLDQKMGLIEDLANQLSVVHQAESFHGGLRPSSIYVASGDDRHQEVRISDFGLGFISGTQFLEAGDILFYLSPEQLATGDYSGEQGKLWDVYSFGVIAFQLLTGHLPRLDLLYGQCMESPSTMEGVSAISYGRLTEASEHFCRQLEREQSVEWPVEAQSDREKLFRPIIEYCLAYNAGERYQNMADVAAALEFQIKQAADAPVPEKAEPAPVAEIPVEVEEKKAKPREKTLPELVSASEPAPAPEKSKEEQGVPESAPKKKKRFASAEEPKWQPGTAAALIYSMFGRPHFWWQIGSIILILILLPLAIQNVVLRYQVKDTEEQLTVKNQEYQQSVEDQAATYRQLLNSQSKNSEQLQSELEEAEDDKSRLVGESKLARQVIRQAQDNGDKFFRLVLDNRDTDVPGFRERRKQALLEGQKHYERLIEVYGNAPDFIESTANAMFYLGEIYKETGEFGKALAAFGESQRRYMAIIKNSDGINLDYLKNLARAKRSLGELAEKNGRYSSAMNFFNESSGFWREIRKEDEKAGEEAAVKIYENSLDIVECERSMGNVGAALDGARSIGVQLLELQEKNKDDPAVVSLLAKSFALAGLMLENQGQDIEKAIEAYQQASNLYAEAVRQNAAVDSYQLGLGNSLARVGLLKNDLEKLKGAADVLAKVVPHNPYEAEYQRTLADVFGAMSENQRDGGKIDKAIELEEKAVSILKPLVEGNENAPDDVLYSYAERLSHLAELKGDAGNFDDSREPLKNAIDILASIAHGENGQPGFRRALAHAQGLAGFASIKAGDRVSAKQHYELAQAEWETYMSLNPSDSEAERAAQWTREQLKSLQ